MARAPKKAAATKDEEKQDTGDTEPKKTGRGMKAKAKVAKAEKPAKKTIKKAEEITAPKANGKGSPKANGKGSPKANGKTSPKTYGKVETKSNGKAKEVTKTKAAPAKADAKTKKAPTKAAAAAGKKKKAEEPIAAVEEEDEESSREEVEETEEEEKPAAANIKAKKKVTKTAPATKKSKKTPPKADKETEESKEEDEEKEDKTEEEPAPPAANKRGRKRQAEAEPKAAASEQPEVSFKKAKIVVERRSALDNDGGSCLSLGQGDTGQLGLGEDIMERAKPALVNSIPAKVACVVAGGMHSLALTVDGVVYSLGCNDEGALGRAIEDDEEGFTPGEVKITGDNDSPLKIVQISAGDSHSVALGENGKAYYWGTFRDSSGSFGLTPDGAIRKLPVALAHNLDVAKISSGSDHIALLTTAGELYTLGCGEQGQLGRVGERFTARGGRRGIALLLEPDRVHSKNRRAVFTDVWAGSYDTLALTEKNEVLACGLNNYNQLGISKGMVFHTLTKSKGLSDNKGKWAQIAFGQHHALCLDDEGRVYAVGRAEYGRLGLGQANTDDGKADAKVPTLVPALEGKKCVEISCGTCVSFAVTEDGKCFSWGMGTNGQLGHAEDEDAWEPVSMLGKQLETRSVLGVSGGGQHTVLIAKDAAAAATN